MRRILVVLAVALACAWALADWLSPALALPLVLGAAFCT